MYDNGPYDDVVDAWEINHGFVASDTFTLTGTVTGFHFNTWMFPGDVLTTAELSLTSNEFGGTTYFDQTLHLTRPQCVECFSLAGPLAAIANKVSTLSSPRSWFD
ncbi:MAG: hypothetical protein P4N59_05745 [Negativicutes bacterium]|nr:hypothetical protein [Negativicutes bacterium]